MRDEEAVVARIKNLLRSHQKGLTIEQISKKLPLNRNSTARYLNTLIMSGQAELQVYGRAKVYVNSHRIPSSQLFSYASDMILLLDEEKKIQLANKPLRGFFDLGAANLVDQNLEDTPLSGFFTQPACQQQIDNAIRGMPLTLDHCILHNGRSQMFRLNIIPVVLEGGGPGIAIFIEETGDGSGSDPGRGAITPGRSPELVEENLRLHQEIEQYEQISAALSEREERYRSLVESVVDGFYQADLNGILISANAGFLSLMRFDSPEQAIGHPLADLWETPGHRKELLAAMRETGFVRDFETTLLKKDMTPVTVSVSSRFYYDASGNAAGIEGIIRDITVRKHLEQSLLEREEKFRRIVESFPDVYFELDLAHAIIFVSPSCQRILGYAPDEIIGRNFLGFCADPQRGTLILEDLHTSRRLHDIELELIDKNSHYFPVSVNCQITADAAGDPVRITGTIHDISERKRREDLLHQSEDVFRSLVLESFDGIVITNEEGVVIEWNHALSTISGISRPLAIGKDLFSIMVQVLPPGQRTSARKAEIRTGIESILLTGTVLTINNPTEMEIYPRDRKRRTILWTVFPIRTARGFRIGSVIRDITGIRAGVPSLEESKKTRHALIGDARGGAYRNSDAEKQVLAGADPGIIPAYDPPDE
jgi:PAS domain S-box-containing protein